MRPMYRHITLSGELGAGKTSVAGPLSRDLGLPVFSTGALQRKMSADAGQSTLETNLRAERDTSIDDRIDGETKRRGGPAEAPHIFDSRMAFNFVHSALKVYLVVDPIVAARRIAGRNESGESFSSWNDAFASSLERSRSERTRFRDKYGVDIYSLRNYDLVIDTTTTQIKDVVEIVAKAFRASPQDLRVFVDPNRVKPGIPANQVPECSPPLRPVKMGYFMPSFFCSEADDHALIRDAILSGHSLIEGTLEFEESETFERSISAQQFFADRCTESTLEMWDVYLKNRLAIFR
jgi:CMP/dCMP kinase